MSLITLDSHIKKLVSSERKITDQILKAITELDGRRGYAELGFSSLFSYLTQGVGYSESAAQRRLTSARLMTKISQPVQSILRSKLQEGALNLSQVSKLGSMMQAIEKAAKNKPNSNSTILEPENPITADSFVKSLLPQIEHQGSVKTDSAIASAAQDLFPHLDLEINKTEPKVKIKQGAAGKVTITLTLTAEQNEKLQKVLAKKSHAIANNDINILFEKLLDKELKDYDVKTKPESKPCIDSASSYTTDTAVANIKSQKRKYISVKIKRRVFANADHQCQYQSPLTGERCKEKNFLTIDHVKPLALGGADDESNYQCYCSSHNLAEARRMGISLKTIFIKTE